MSHRSKILLVTTALLALGACSSNDTPPVTDTVVLPPGDTSPPATQFTLGTLPVGSSLALNAHVGLETFAVTNSTEAGAETDIPRGTLAANPTAAYVTTATGFAVMLPDGKTVSFVTVPGSLQLTGTQTYQSTVDGGTDTVDLTLTNAAASTLTYSTYGSWVQSSSLNHPVAYGTLATGINTTAAQMPTTGSASYSGRITGRAISPTAGAAITDGAITLNANFAANTINGSVTGIVTQNGGVTPNIGSMNNINLTGGTISSGAFSGVATAAAATSGTTINVTGASGAFGGRFYGPAAAEAAGSLSMTGNGSTVIAAFGTKKN